MLYNWISATHSHVNHSADLIQKHLTSQEGQDVQAAWDSEAQLLKLGRGRPSFLSLLKFSKVKYFPFSTNTPVSMGPTIITNNNS